MIVYYLKISLPQAHNVHIVSNIWNFYMYFGFKNIILKTFWQVSFKINVTIDVTTLCGHNTSAVLVALRLITCTHSYSITEFFCSTWYLLVITHILKYSFVTH